MRLLLLPLLLIPLCLPITGCASTRQVAQAPDTAKPVKASLARICIGREVRTKTDSEEPTAAWPLKVYIDGAYVGRMGRAGVMVVDHLPGSFTLHLTGGRSEPKAQVFEAAAGRVTCISIGLDDHDASFITAETTDRSAQWLAAYGAPAVAAPVYHLDDPAAK